MAWNFWSVSYIFLALSCSSGVVGGKQDQKGRTSSTRELYSCLSSVYSNTLSIELCKAEF